MRLRQAKTINIIGAGLTGSLLSVFLLRAGWRVRLFEKRGDPRTVDAYSGRSINLAMARRGLHALEQVELLEEIQPHLMPMRGRMIHPKVGERTLQPYGQNDREVIYSVHRGTLNRILVEAAATHDNFELICHRKLVGIDSTLQVLSLENAQDKTVESLEVDGPVIAADGAGSRTRRILEARSGQHSKVDFLDHGYKELKVPALTEGRYAFDPAALHIWPRGGFMQIALPNKGGSYTNTLFLDKARFEKLDSAAAARAFLTSEFADLDPWLEHLTDNLIEHPVGLLGTVYCSRWAYDDRVLLIGDAAHAIVPFHGQGMNCCFEDCTRLAELLTDGRRTWRSVFQQFEKQRKPNTDAIAMMALENYDEMRSDVIDPTYVLKRQLELALERRYRDRFIPRYSLVMFHRVPYALALARGAIQAGILDQLTADNPAPDDIDMHLAERLIMERLPELA